jgi:1-acyl-sn-glycerol-3-phosphate acyltransferase
MSPSGPSLRASLELVTGLLRISSGTLMDALGKGVTREASDERLGWWAHAVARQSRLDIRIEGREHLDVLRGGEPFVVMSNHQSHLDIPTLFYAVSPGLRMVTKKELFRFPIWGEAMRRSGFIEIDRGNQERAIASLKMARKTLEQGVSVWVSPEGTRSRTGALLPFKKGGFMLALEVGARILPVGLAGTRDALPVGAARIRPGQSIGVTVGAPLTVQGKDRDALIFETRQRIESLVEQSQRLRA